MLVHYLFDIGRGYALIKSALGIYHDNGTVGAKAETACHNYLYFFFQPCFLYSLVKFFQYLLGVSAGASLFRRKPIHDF